MVWDTIRKLNNERKQLTGKQKFDFLILLGAIVILYVPILSSEVSNPLTLDKRNIEFVATDYLDQTKEYHVNVEFDSLVFQADKTINTNIILRPMNNVNENIVFVTFTGSHQEPLTDAGFGNAHKIAVINSTKNSIGNYVGNGKLSYDMQGCYGIKLSSKPLGLDNQFKKDEDCKIMIEPKEYFSLTNRTIYSLTVITVALSLIAIRPIILDILRDHTSSVKDKSKKDLEK